MKLKLCSTHSNCIRNFEFYINMSTTVDKFCGRRFFEVFWVACLERSIVFKYKLKGTGIRNRLSLVWNWKVHILQIDSTKLLQCVCDSWRGSERIHIFHVVDIWCADYVHYSNDLKAKGVHKANWQPSRSKSLKHRNQGTLIWDISWQNASE